MLRPPAIVPMESGRRAGKTARVRLTFLSKVSLDHSKAYILNRQSESHLMKMHMHLRNISFK